VNTAHRVLTNIASISVFRSFQDCNSCRLYYSEDEHHDHKEVILLIDKPLTTLVDADYGLAL